jgi:iron(III) transport system permease protein
VALLLPMALPAYLLAYAATDLLEYSGPLQTALRALFGWSSQREYWFPQIRSLGGAMVVLSLTLYPYVYLLARTALIGQSVCAAEASRVLGRGPWRTLFRVTLPLIRPSLVAGVALVAMEVVADFGAVQHFGVNTLTIGIFRVWFGMGSREGASQLAAILLLGVVALLLLERGLRGGGRTHGATSRFLAIRRVRTRPWVAGLLASWCALPPLLGFVLPLIVFGRMTLEHGDTQWATFGRLATNSLSLAVLAALIAVAIGAIVAFAKRFAPSRTIRLAARLGTLGYALPGAALAVGVVIPLGWLDNTVDGWARAALGISTGLLLSGTIAALVFAHVARFLALSVSTLDAGLTRVRRSIDDASRSLGASLWRTIGGVHVPMLKGSFLSAVLLVFVDVMKELPATLIVRPFNLETLATRVYRLAADERLYEASTAALAIAAVGLLPVIVLSIRIGRSRPGDE